MYNEYVKSTLQLCNIILLNQFKSAMQRRNEIILQYFVRFLYEKNRLYSVHRF